MANSNNNSNKKKFTTSELNIDVKALTNLLTSEIKKLDTLSFNQHKQIEQCQEVIENLGQIFNKLKDTSIHLSKDMESNSELQSYLFDSLKQLTQDVKTLETISNNNKAQCDSLSHLNGDLVIFFDGKNKEFRITRDNFNEVIIKLAAINTSLTEIKSSLEKLPSEQERLLTTYSTNTQNSITNTQTSITNAQNSINEVVTNSKNIANGINGVNNSVAKNHKEYLSSWWYELAAFLLLLFICLYSARSNRIAKETLSELKDSIKSLNSEIKSMKNTPTPTPTVSPNKSDKKQK